MRVVTKKLISFNTIVCPILEYASPVWSLYNKGLIEKLETVQRRAVKWAYGFATLESITDCMEDIDINNYVSFNLSHFTRHSAINPHYRLDQFKYSFYNRMSSSLHGHNIGTF